MNTVLHDFTGSFCIATMSMFNSADVLTEIELAVKCNLYSLLSSIALTSPGPYLS